MEGGRGANAHAERIVFVDVATLRASFGSIAIGKRTTMHKRTAAHS
jgi:hypothetical protein